jgi:hypothetical protein
LCACVLRARGAAGGCGCVRVAPVARVFPCGAAGEPAAPRGVHASCHLRALVCVTVCAGRYNGVWAYDRDDDSQFIADTTSFMVFGGCKNYLGHTKVSYRTGPRARVQIRTRFLLKVPGRCPFQGVSVGCGKVQGVTAGRSTPSPFLVHVDVCLRVCNVCLWLWTCLCLLVMRVRRGPWPRTAPLTPSCTQAPLVVRLAIASARPTTTASLPTSTFPRFTLAACPPVLLLRIQVCAGSGKRATHPPSRLVVIVIVGCGGAAPGITRKTTV